MPCAVLSTPSSFGPEREPPSLVQRGRFVPALRWGTGAHLAVRRGSGPEQNFQGSPSAFHSMSLSIPAGAQGVRDADRDKGRIGQEPRPLGHQPFRLHFLSRPRTRAGVVASEHGPHEG